MAYQEFSISHSLIRRMDAYRTESKDFLLLFSSVSIALVYMIFPIIFPIQFKDEIQFRDEILVAPHGMDKIMLYAAGYVQIVKSLTRELFYFLIILCPLVPDYHIILTSESKGII